ncbi:hypothetical protein Dimus_008548 [Dionaea muscipula]
MTAGSGRVGPEEHVKARIDIPSKGKQVVEERWVPAKRGARTGVIMEARQGAEELMVGYDRKNVSPRCIAKIDIRKAYDSVRDDVAEEMGWVSGVLELGFGIVVSGFVQELTEDGRFLCIEVEILFVGFEEEVG